MAAALRGDAVATRELVDALMPVVHVRVARVLVRRRAGRDVAQEVEDLAQEVFVALFAEDGRALRAWDPARGLGLTSFVGLVAEREASSILRSGKRSPWKEEATELDELEEQTPAVPDAEQRVMSRQELGQLVDRLREALSPLGLEMFQRLVVEEESVESVCARTGMSADAVYAWKSRISKLTRKLCLEPLAPLSDPAPVRRNPR